MSGERIPKVTAKCRCNAVTLDIFEVAPAFTACDCSTCQFIHSGPGFGASANDVKVVEGVEFVKAYKPAAWATWHFCGKCGSRLHYEFDPKLWKNKENRYVVSVGLLHEAGAKGFEMAEEVSIDEKPPYYRFAGIRPERTTSETYALYAVESQKR